MREAWCDETERSICHLKIKLTVTGVLFGTGKQACVYINADVSSSNDGLYQPRYHVKMTADSNTMKPCCLFRCIEQTLTLVLLFLLCVEVLFRCIHLINIV